MHPTDDLHALRIHPATHRAHRWYRHLAAACGMTCPPTLDQCSPELVALLRKVGVVLPATQTRTPDADASFAAYRMLLRLRGCAVPATLDELPHHRQTVIRAAAETLAAEANRGPAPRRARVVTLRERLAERWAG